MAITKKPTLSTADGEQTTAPVVNNADEFTPRRAKRSAAKLRLALDGVSGSGKTFSALEIAFGLVGNDGKIVVIDTENSSADLYAHLGEYDTVSLNPPYSPERYISAIKKMEELKYDVIIIDSLSANWAGEGGALEKQTAVTKRTGNGYTSWSEVTPGQNRLMEAMLQSPCHIIATMRSKIEYVIDKDASGKTTIRKMGLMPIQRNGVEHEFTIVFDMDQDHIAAVSKDRSGLFDGKSFKPSRETGKQLAEWLKG